MILATLSFYIYNYILLYLYILSPVHLYTLTVYFLPSRRMGETGDPEFAAQAEGVTRVRCDLGAAEKEEGGRG